MKLRILVVVGALLVGAISACVSQKRNDPGCVPKNINAKFLAEDLKPEEWINVSFR